MKYCIYCGKELPDEARFCLGCGKEFVVNGMNDIKVSTNLGDTNNNPFAYNATPKQKADNNIPKAIAVASIMLAFFGTFMPFFVVTVLGTSKSVSLLSPNFIVLTIIGYIFLIVELVEVVSNHPKVKRDTIVISFLLFIELILQYCINRGRMKIETTYGSYDLGDALSVGAGFYILIAAGVGLLIAGLLYDEISR